MGSLDKFLEDHEDSVEISELKMMCVHIARGMSYLHSRDIIHNDLAARNVLLTPNNVPDDGKYLCKVSDFGLSSSLQTKYVYGSSETVIPVR